MSEMSYESFLPEEMKENMDANIMHIVRNLKEAGEKPNKSIRKEPFRELNGQAQSKHIKKHAYIVDSDEEQSPSKSTRKQCKSHRSIDSVSQILGSLSKQSSIPTSPKCQLSIPITTCTIHSLQVHSYNFCIECSEFLMCPSCVKHTHGSHMILTFTTEQQTKAMSKQFLIEKIQETLQKLKSKQNDIKNKTTEMELILTNVKKMEEEVMTKLQTVFREIAQIVRTVYEKQSYTYESKIDDFYQKYNGVGDQLRENLLTIIDESFELKTFEVSSVCKQPPAIPDESINKFKSVLQKTKSFYKGLIESIQELKQKAIDKSKTVCGVKALSSKNTVIARRQASNKKYEKFLSDACFQSENTGQISKSSLIKILDTLSK